MPVPALARILIQCVCKKGGLLSIDLLHLIIMTLLGFLKCKLKVSQRAEHVIKPSRLAA